MTGRVQVADNIRGVIRMARKCNLEVVLITAHCFRNKWGLVLNGTKLMPGNFPPAADPPLAGNSLQFSMPGAVSSRRPDRDQDKRPLIPMRISDWDDVANRRYTYAL